ncbi:MAG: DUF3332 domain-containing protein [Prevotella sp.]|nr:DUF3332 domain-containing protein [Prevotella sp.]MCM1075615.1 DUF3332 domain-containing protein [Ruminococcus sp.]
MKKTHFTVAAVLSLAGCFMFSSCIGQFALTNKVLTWNDSVGNKFVNELVFVAFWILPVYEVTAIADLLVINSIEFWSGSNPVAKGSKVIDTDNGRYLVKCDGKGYDVVCEATGETVRLDFIEDEQTWAVNIDGELHPFMTFVDDNHVKMITPEGDFSTVELSNQGVMAYTHTANMPFMAAK